MRKAVAPGSKNRLSHFSPHKNMEILIMAKGRYTVKEAQAIALQAGYELIHQEGWGERFYTISLNGEGKVQGQKLVPLMQWIEENPLPRIEESAELTLEESTSCDDLAMQSPLTCAACPFFQSYNEPSGRGYCPCNDRVVYAHHEKSQECDRVREIEAEFIQPRSWAQAQSEVETYLEAQVSEIAPEPLSPANSYIGWCLPGGKKICAVRLNYEHFPVCTNALSDKQKESAIKGCVVPGLWAKQQTQADYQEAIAGDNVAIRLQSTEIVYDPRTESKPEAIAFLTAFLAHTSSRDVPEVARAEWDQCNILTGGYYCNEWEEIINVKVVINWKAGTYQRNDTFCDGALAAVWGNLRGMELSHINFDFSRLPIDSAKQERRAAVLQYRFTEAIAIIATEQPGVVERVTLDSVIVRLEDGSLKEVAPDEIKHVEAPWKGVKWTDLSLEFRRNLKRYNPSQNVLDKHKKELVRVIKK